MQNQESDAKKGGFDAALTSPLDDHLERWAFAQEIARIVSEGPSDWSVRVGIYGEWGSGKSSVLNFVQRIANDQGQIVVRFNPWQFHSTDEMWKHFVQFIYKQLQISSKGKLPGALGRRAKAIFSSARPLIPRVMAIGNQEAAKLIDTGLGFLKNFLTFSQADLAELKQVLGKRRLIILIDDLDRTDPKLVPEMLFALKEIMDVPSMAFVCAFDPQVIGEVLGKFHPGFGDGLSFLEKIIDYPRWLPKPTPEQLARLAMADAAKYCPFVPQEYLKNAVVLLPKNPRAIRQFVRLLTLLRPQIQRHRANEIDWPILLAANVLKVRFPKIAEELFEDQEFWHSLYQRSVMDKDDGRERSKVIDEEIDKLCSASGEKLDTPAKAALSRSLTAIAEKITVWFGIRFEGLMYQFHLAERPCAVTWKEFDEFLARCGDTTFSKEIVSGWIDSHSIESGQSKEKVFHELFQAAVNARDSALGKAADATEEALMLDQMKRARILLDLVRVLSFDLGEVDSQTPRLTADDLKPLVESMAQYFSWQTGEAYKEARKHEETFLLELTSSWGPELMPLLGAIGLERWEGHHDLRGAEWQALVKNLRHVIKSKFALWIIDNFRKPGFKDAVLYGKDNGHRVRPMLIDKNEALWGERKSEMIAALHTASSSDVVRRNAFEIAEWLDYLLRKKEPGFELVEALLAEEDIAIALWDAITAKPLNPRAVGSVLDLSLRLEKNHPKLTKPVWWTRTVSQFNKPSTNTGADTPTETQPSI